MNEITNNIFNIFEAYSNERYPIPYVRYNSPSLTATYNRAYTTTSENLPYRLFLETIIYMARKDIIVKGLICTIKRENRDHSSTYINPKDMDLIYPQRNKHGATCYTELQNFSLNYRLASGITTIEATSNYTENINIEKWMRPIITNLLDNKGFLLRVFTNPHYNTTRIYYNNYNYNTIRFLTVYSIINSLKNNYHRLDEPIKSIINTLEKIFLKDFDPNLYKEKFSGNLNPELLTELFNSIQCYETYTVSDLYNEEILNKTITRWLENTNNKRITKIKTVIDNRTNQMNKILEDYNTLWEDYCLLNLNLDTLNNQNVNNAPLKELFNNLRTEGCEIIVKDESVYTLITVPFCQTNNPKLLEQKINEIDSLFILGKTQGGFSSSKSLDKTLKYFYNMAGVKKRLTEIIENFNLIHGKNIGVEFLETAFIKSLKEVLKNIFIKKTITMPLSALLKWNFESSNDNNLPEIKAISFNYYPTELNSTKGTKIWNPHFTYFNCWSAARAEVLEALRNNNYLKALDYIKAGIGQITYPETAGDYIFAAMVGRHSLRISNYSDTNLHVQKLYTKLNSKEKFSLFDLVIESFNNELEATIETEEKNNNNISSEKVNSCETIKKELSDVDMNVILIRLNSDKYPVQDFNLLEAVYSTEGALFLYNKQFLLHYINSGDFLTDTVYKHYKQNYPQIFNNQNNLLEENNCPYYIEDNSVFIKNRLTHAIEFKINQEGRVKEYIEGVTAR